MVVTLVKRTPRLSAGEANIFSKLGGELERVKGGEEDLRSGHSEDSDRVQIGRDERCVFDALT